MCNKLLRCLWWILLWIYHRVLCCLRSRENVYLLDLENTEKTKTFAGNFPYFIGPSIMFESVISCSDCKEPYPIALLSIRHTDRPSDDIESILDKLRGDLNERTVLIYIHVRHKKHMLPRIATKKKISEHYDKLGDILDFGLIDESIEECVYDREIKSKEAFKQFVMAGKAYFTPQPGYNPIR